MREKNVLWNSIKGFEGYYEATATGEVRSVDRVISTQRGKRSLKGKILKPKMHNDGYEFYTLSKGNETSNVYGHRVVAELYVPNPFDKPIVNHKDGNPSNNASFNLEWVTHQENVIHAYDTGLNSNKGASHYKSVVIKDEWTKGTFPSIKEWSLARGINYSTARNILSGYSSLKSVDQNLLFKLKSDDHE